ncbi:MAG: winged helix-turn-helix domain-containing protein [Sphingobacteriaceae bacterium]|nr:winged helix-turn-helix domain-containing protein [Sphingobacteriaceae bacterium]
METFDNTMDTLAGDKPQNFELTVIMDSFFSYYAKLWIFNEFGKLLHKPAKEAGYFRHFSLVKGTYILRVEISGQVADNKVDLKTNMTFSIGSVSHAEYSKLKVPGMYSSAPLRGVINYISSHDYYTKAAVAISKQNTFIPKTEGSKKSGLFIFLRYPSAEIYEKIFDKVQWKDFALLDQNEKIIVKFPNGTVDDPKTGFIGFSAFLAPGLYFLRYQGRNKRMMPIYVYESWYTQLFMTVTDEPLWGSTRMFISEKRAFNPSDKYQPYIDICLDKLQNNDFTIDNNLLENIAFGKYTSPMLGLLGAYLYLTGKERQNDGLFKNIVRNLQNKILKNSQDSPDIWALNLLSYQHFRETISTNEKASINGTPTLRIAFDTIRKAALTYQWLVPENSLNDYISENQYFDSPYNTFKPFFHNKQLKQSPIKKSSRVPRRDDDMQIDDYFSTKFITSWDIKSHEFKADDYQLLQAALDHAQDSGLNISSAQDENKVPSETRLAYYRSLLLNPERVGVIGCAIINELIANPSTDSYKIADRIKLPVNTVNRIVKSLNL